ncbi:YwaF family protein [Chengkuizengella axinellae]|uniref:TIGR02206 family membrane protein n=1 Tax=Chengkuizengella axinellae TaxID=3064388 RepID=A0ABT9J4B3_9BACL|nr:TIGR02206 family membrane protein [Chengkuizengella sp. 2205SS18-9]MDP5276457.1 TIGR02206 family membrane protein [Chengkuizengella sp. 2205SS18-9]
MLSFIQPDGDNQFVLFSLEHLLSLFTVIAIILVIYWYRNSLKKTLLNNLSRGIIITILIISEISLHAWLWWVDEWGFRNALPLHLSSISLLLAALLLWIKSYRLFEFTYFVGIGSALQAMITPDISLYTFPHFRYVQFFIAHGGIVIANFFMVFVEGFRPTLKSLWRAFFYLNLYTLFIFAFNLFIGSNYMYVSRKPFNPSLIDYLGPWPWYIIPLEIIALVTFFMLYLPFWFLERKGMKEIK